MGDPEAATKNGRVYGDAVAHSLRLQGVPSIMTSSLATSQIAVSRLSVGVDQIGMTPRVPCEDTFIVALYLTEVAHHELWSGGRPVIRQGYAQNAMRIVNLVGEFRANITCPHETMAFYIPRRALDDFADDAGIRRVHSLACQPGVVDPVMVQLAQTLLPVFHEPDAAYPLFVDHLLLATSAHLVGRYGGGEPNRLVAKGGLTPRQAARAKEFLAAHLAVSITLGDVATCCGLSRAHFAKAFRRATGSTPHQWLMRYRIDRAKTMMAETVMPIADVAVACGFADQSHLTRVFSRMTGASPAAWRRQRQS